MTVRCRDCCLYDLDAVRNARGAVMSNKAARCLWQSTEPWPVSVTEKRRPSPGWMEPNVMHDCQTFQPRTNA